MGTGVLLFAETFGTELKKSALELAGAGGALASSLGGPLAAVLVGADVAGAAGAIAGRGVGRVYTVEDAGLGNYTADAYAAALARVVGEADPAVVLLAASAMGKDLGPALAAKLEAPIVSDAVELGAEDGQVRAVRPVYAGKTLIRVASGAPRVVVSLRPNIFEPAPEGGDAGETVAVPLDLAAEQVRTAVVDVVAPEVRTVDLTEADVIVSGGRGMKGPENFHLVEELAAALGGVVGASRAVVDAGWRPHSEQVGQTGKTVSPKLYVACGISGAIQHLAGMSSSKCIVAVNKDPEAPIFKVADYGIVGDVMDVLPALTAAVNEKVGA